MSANVIEATQPRWVVTGQEILRARQQADERARLRPSLAQDPGQAGENFRNARAAISQLADEFRSTFDEGLLCPGDDLILAMFDD